ncbi:unnamed protein product [Diatraea saccharalis]|uniref:Uncharacterized protein n=1 Tax=Diatraea saccharalis TaxID=40085 RepID=A0A9N9RFI8_9NEOP|nr:unnamed protein product [Diatraea saccharalis]
MVNWSTLFLFVVIVAGKAKEETGPCPTNCQGEEYKCLEGKCYCADGFIQDYFQTECIKCPELGQKCFGTCCNSLSNTSLQCWHGICQPCSDANGNWSCRDSVDQALLITTTQLVMGIALVLGIIATFMLLLKLCTVSRLRLLGTSRRSDSDRLSVGSLHMYVEERLRDAPPRFLIAVFHHRRIQKL